MDQRKCVWMIMIFTILFSYRGPSSMNPITGKVSAPAVHVLV